MASLPWLKSPSFIHGGEAFRGNLEAGWRCSSESKLFLACTVAWVPSPELKAMPTSEEHVQIKFCDNKALETLSDTMMLSKQLGHS